MIKVIGMDGWIGSVGLTNMGKREVVRIPRATLERLVSLERGEIGLVSVSALRRRGKDAGFYYSLGGDIDMWVSPTNDEQDGSGSVSTRITDMYTRQGVRVNMRALSQIVTSAQMIGPDKVCILAKAGYWMVVENATCRVIVKEEDIALRMAYLTQGMMDSYFEARDVKRVLDSVRQSNPFYEQWDINGNGDIRMWLGEDGMLLSYDRAGGEIAYNCARDIRVSLYDGISADEWMERYTVWEEAMKLIRNGDKGVNELLWDNEVPIDEFVESEWRELGVDWP